MMNDELKTNLLHTTPALNPSASPKNGQRITNNEQRITGNEQRITGNEQRITGNEHMKNTFGLLAAFFSLALGACSVKPVAEFSIPAQKFVAPAEVRFTNTSLKAESYAWDFGDGGSSTEMSPSHRYTHSGNYTVVLKATKGSKTVTRKQMIQVTAPERCLVEIETEFGTMTAELYNATPKHRDNFIKLAEEGYYNDLLFHRVIKNFMIQGGDPNSRNAPAGQSLGFGGPSHLVPAEFVDTLAHFKGALCAARTNNPEKKSSGSQFYIVQGGPVTADVLTQIETMKRFHYTPDQRAEYLAVGGTPHLDRDYTVFGRVIKGLDVIDKIAASPTGPGDRPSKDVKMKILVIK
jgi:peptidyl-prolyl cis-trans isomerase B (cyclophilin B)